MFVKVLSILGILIFGVLILLFLVYLMQEKIIFYPTKLAQDHPFEFDSDYEELSIVAEDSVFLNGLLFTVDSSAGLIFYLHGNAGALDSWGEVAEEYTKLNYDIFIFDYRGYGKSEGSISSEDQVYSDIQIAYNELKQRYNESDIIVLGYSMGTAPAAKLAAENNPRMLILQAPYFSMLDIKDKIYPFLPDFIVKYKFETYKYLEKVKAPVVIFHGDKDEVVYYGSSEKLQKYLKPTDKFITLKGQAHNGITYNPEYQKQIAKILKD